MGQAASRGVSRLLGTVHSSLSDRRRRHHRTATRRETRNQNAEARTRGQPPAYLLSRVRLVARPQRWSDMCVLFREHLRGHLRGVQDLGGWSMCAKGTRSARRRLERRHDAPQKKYVARWAASGPLGEASPTSRGPGEARRDADAPSRAGSPNRVNPLE